MTSQSDAYDEYKALFDTFAQTDDTIRDDFGRLCAFTAKLTKQLRAAPPCTNCPKCGGDCKEMPCAYPEDCEHPCFDYIYERNQALLRAASVQNDTQRSVFSEEWLKSMETAQPPASEAEDIDAIAARLFHLPTPWTRADAEKKMATIKRELAALRADGGSTKQRRIRYAPAIEVSEGNRQCAWDSGIAQIGDARLVWVNEGDLIELGEKVCDSKHSG